MAEEKIKIPDSELVKRAIYQILREHGIVRTQEQLAEMVEGELKRLDDEYEISPERARRIALEVAGLELDIKKRKGDDERPEICPVCGAGLHEKVSNNLEGERVIVGVTCPQCDYDSDLKEFMPRQYDFRLVRKDE